MTCEEVRTRTNKKLAKRSHQKQRRKKVARVVHLMSNDTVRACLDAYPSPTDYYNINVNSIDAQSGIVYAALLLSNARVSKFEVAFRLRSIAELGRSLPTRFSQEQWDD